MYENKARLMCTAEGTPFDLFKRIVTVADAHNIAPRTSSRSRKNDDFDLCVDNELGFAKDRTISRYVLFCHYSWVDMRLKVIKSHLNSFSHTIFCNNIK